MAQDQQVTKFGHAQKEHWLFDPKWTNLNHGSFGSYPRQVRNVLRAYQDLTEMAPDRFIIHQRIGILDESRRQVAELIHADTDECVFVQNATTGVNIFLRNLVYEEKDAIIYFATTYGACEKTLMSIQETNPQVHLRMVDYQMPISHADLCTEFSQTISRLIYEGYRPKAALFDTISSLPGCRFPFEKLVKICREYNILSVIDGAHGIGQIPLNMAELQPDFFVSNCHKWLYTPRGCAVLYVPRRNQHLIRTTFPTSHGYKPKTATRGSGFHLPPTGKPDFVNLFDFVATVDNNPNYTIPAALAFRQKWCQGEEAIHKYIRDIAQGGADIIAAHLGTKVMDDRAEGSSSNYTGSIRDCSMANVMLPISIEGGQADPVSGDEQWLTVQLANVPTVTVWMQKILINEFDTHLQIYAHAGRVWVRISGQVYLELSDFERAAEALQHVLTRVRDGEALRTASTTKVKAPGLSEAEIDALGAGLTKSRIS